MGATILRGTECAHLTWLHFLLSLCTKEGPQAVAPCSWLLFRTVFNRKSTSSLSPRWAERAILFRYGGCLPFASLPQPLCYDSALIKGNGCKVNMLGTQGTSPWIKLPSWKWSLARGTLSPVDSGPSTACRLWTVRDLRVLWASLRSSATPTASHRGLSEPRPAPQAELEAPHTQRLDWPHGAGSSRLSEKANSWNSQFSAPIKSGASTLFSRLSIEN